MCEADLPRQLANRELMRHECVAMHQADRYRSNAGSVHSIEIRAQLVQILVVKMRMGKQPAIEWPHRLLAQLPHVTSDSSTLMRSPVIPMITSP